MNWLFGNKKGNTPTPDTALRIQTAVLGKPIPILYGQTRFAGSMIDNVDFKANPVSQGGKGGFLGGGKGGVTSFTYSVAVILAMCEGPINAVLGAWSNTDTVAESLASLDLSVFLGTSSQTAWGYMTSNHPTFARNYRNLAYLAGVLNLGTSVNVPNLNYEARSSISNGLPGVPDAHPADVITDYLTNSRYGLGLPPANLDNLTTYRGYASCLNFMVSDALVSQQTANTYLQDLADATNSQWAWLSGKLTLVPYGDISLAANGATYTPPTTVADLDDDDFLPNMGGSGSSTYTGQDPVLVTRTPQAATSNDIQVEYLDRTNFYNPTVVEARDDADIQSFTIRTAPAKTYHFFCNAVPAQMSADLLLNRQALRNIYAFTLPATFIWLDPMDLVTLTDVALGLNKQWVRIIEITEQTDGTLQFVAEEFLQGMGNAPARASTVPCCLGGIDPRKAPPGPTIFAYWDASLVASPTGPALFVVAAGQGQPAIPAQGEKGIISVWYFPKYFADNPTASGTQVIFESETNDRGGSGDDSFALVANFDGTNVQIGLQITATDTAGVQHSLSVYAPNLPEASIPAGGYGIVASWDLTGSTWAINVRVSGGTVGSGTVSAGESMDGTDFPLFQNPRNGTYSIGSGGTTGPIYWARLWIGLDDDVDNLDLALGDALYSSFFCDTSTHANAPKNTNSDGSTVTGCPPAFFFGGYPGTGTGVIGPGTSTGCISGAVLPNTAGSGSAGAIGAGTIPACGTFQAQGTSFSGTFNITGPEPFGGLVQTWGSAEVFISTDGGSTYHSVGVIPGPSPIGKLTALYPSGSDPDTVNTLSVDLTESLGSLQSYADSDADIGRSRCVIMDTVPEIIAYSTATLVSGYTYHMGTYVRRGQEGSAIGSHAAGTTFGQLGVNALEISYPASLIGSTIHVKFVASNLAGTVSQTLAEVPDNTITLVGPGDPAAPASLTAVEPVALSASAVLNWPASASPGVTGYNLNYNTGGPDTVYLVNSNTLATVIAGLTPGAYTFKVQAVNAAGLVSGWTTTTLTVT